MKMHYYINVIKNNILDLVFPTRCIGCGAEGTVCCQSCIDAVYVVSPSCIVCKRLVPVWVRTPTGRTCQNCRKETMVDVFLSPFIYAGIVRDLLRALKYQRVQSISSVFARVLTQYIMQYGAKSLRQFVIVPLPLHPSRLRRRGYNQSALIARALAKLLHIECDEYLLKRVKRTTPQAGLTRDARMNNLQDAFQVSTSAMLEGRQVLLVDDIKTTGVTLTIAAETLKRAGVRDVWALTVAH